MTTAYLAPDTCCSTTPRDHAGRAAASAMMASNAAGKKLAARNFISQILNGFSVQAFWCAVFLVPVHGLTARVHRHGAHFREVIEGFDAGLAAQVELTLSSLDKLSDDHLEETGQRR